MLRQSAAFSQTKTKLSFYERRRRRRRNTIGLSAGRAPAPPPCNPLLQPPLLSSSPVNSLLLASFTLAALTWFSVRSQCCVLRAAWGGPRAIEIVSSYLKHGECCTWEEEEHAGGDGEAYREEGNWQQAACVVLNASRTPRAAAAAGQEQEQQQVEATGQQSRPGTSRESGKKR